MDMNMVMLVGRLADNVQYTAGQGDKSSRAVGRLIINRPPSKDGTRSYDAIQIVAWGKHADNLAQYTSKGKELGIVGELRVNSVRPTTEGGEWKNYTEVMIKQITFGHDSNRAKMMKAISGGSQMISPAQGADAAAQTAALMSNPAIQAALAQLVQGSAAAQPAPAVAPATAAPTEAVPSEPLTENPFSE